MNFSNTLHPWHWLCLLCAVALYPALPAMAETDQRKEPRIECIGSIGEGSGASAVQGHIMYVGGGYTLRAIDIADPARPREIGWLRMEGSIRQIEARGPALYVTIYQIESNLVLVDASDPARMKIADNLAGGNKGIDIELMGEFLYCHTGGKFGGPSCTIYSLKDPLRPTSVYSAAHLKYEPEGCAFATDGRRLFTINNSHPDQDSMGIVVEDSSSDPAKRIAFIKYGESDERGSLKLDTNTGKVTYEGGATSASLTLGKLDPTNLWWLSSGDYDVIKFGIQKNAPVPSRVQADASNSVTGDKRGVFPSRIPVHAVKVVDRIAYAVGERRLSVIDCRKPERPALLGGCDLPDKVTVCAVEHDMVYAAGEAGMLYAMDVTKPAAPALRGSLKISTSTLSMAASGNRLFIAAGEAGVQVIDITAPAAMQPAVGYATPEPCLDLATSGTLVYALTPKALYVLDASGAGVPVLKGKLIHRPAENDEFYPDRERYALKRLGNILYLVHLESVMGNIDPAVAIVDVSDPAAPRMLAGVIGDKDIFARPAPASTAAPGTAAHSASNSKTTGWLLGLPLRARSTSGIDRSLEVYDLADPLHPELLDSYAGVESTDQVVLYKDIIYKADDNEDDGGYGEGTGGLIILRPTGKGGARK